MYNYCCVYSNLYWWNKLRQTIWVTLPSLSPRVARTSIILFQLPNAMHWLFSKAFQDKRFYLIQRDIFTSEFLIETNNWLQTKNYTTFVFRRKSRESQYNFVQYILNFWTSKSKVSSKICLSYVTIVVQCNE